MGTSAPPLRLFDVWPMSIKRPDAHQGPPRDCLHWCMIGVMNYWQDVSAGGARTSVLAADKRRPLQLLWTMIIEEANNRDYLL